MIVLDTHIWLWWAHCPLITSDSRILTYPHVKTVA